MPRESSETLQLQASQCVHIILSHYLTLSHIASQCSTLILAICFTAENCQALMGGAMMMFETRDARNSHMNRWSKSNFTRRRTEEVWSCCACPVAEKRPTFVPVETPILSKSAKCVIWPPNCIKSLRWMVIACYGRLLGLSRF